MATALDLSARGLSDASLARALANYAADAIDDLNLRANLLRSIPERSPLPARLTALDLSHNKLVDLRGLAGLPLLRSLELGHNLLVSSAGIGALTSLRRLGLAGNGVGCVEQLEPLRALRELDLRSNLLQSEADLRPLACNGALRSLRLGGNPVVAKAADAAARRQLAALLRGLLPGLWKPQARYAAATGADDGLHLGALSPPPSPLDVTASAAAAAAAAAAAEYEDAMFAACSPQRLLSPTPLPDRRAVRRRPQQSAPQATMPGDTQRVPAWAATGRPSPPCSPCSPAQQRAPWRRPSAMESRASLTRAPAALPEMVTTPRRSSMVGSEWDLRSLRALRAEEAGAATAEEDDDDDDDDAVSVCSSRRSSVTSTGSRRSTGSRSSRRGSMFTLPDGTLRQKPGLHDRGRRASAAAGGVGAAAVAAEEGAARARSVDIPGDVAALLHKVHVVAQTDHGANTRALFRRFDASKSGLIARAELLHMLQLLLSGAVPLAALRRAVEVALPPQLGNLVNQDMFWAFCAAYSRGDSGDGGNGGDGAGSPQHIGAPPPQRRRTVVLQTDCDTRSAPASAPSPAQSRSPLFAASTGGKSPTPSLKPGRYSQRQRQEVRGQQPPAQPQQQQPQPRQQQPPHEVTGRACSFAKRYSSIEPPPESGKARQAKEAAAGQEQQQQQQQQQQRKEKDEANAVVRELAPAPAPLTPPQSRTQQSLTPTPVIGSASSASSTPRRMSSRSAAVLEAARTGTSGSPMMNILDALVNQKRQEREARRA